MKRLTRLFANLIGLRAAQYAAIRADRQCRDKRASLQRKIREFIAVCDKQLETETDRMERVRIINDKHEIIMIATERGITV